MDDTVRIVLIYAVLPVILGIGAWIMKSFIGRLEMIENELVKKVEERQVRQLVADKIDPIREDIQELKQKLDKITDLLIKNNRH